MKRLLALCLLWPWTVFGQFDFTDIPFLAGSVFPPQILDLKVWYRAQDYSGHTNGYSVTNVNDKTGHGNHATNTTSLSPLLTNSLVNGKAAFCFPGSASGRYSIITNNWGSAFTNGEMFAVIRALVTNAASGGPWRFPNLGPGAYHSHPNSDATITEVFCSKQYIQLPLTYGQSAADWHIYNVATELNQMQVRYNGDLIAGLDTVTPGFTNATLFGKDGTDTYGGEIAELMVWTKVLGADARRAVYAYLSAQYGIAYTNAMVRYFPTNFNGLVLWLKPEGLTYNSYADGDAITNWSDASDPKNDFTNRTTAKCPVFKTSVFNGWPAARFAGHLTNQLMVANTNITFGTNFTILIVGQYTNNTCTLLNAASPNDQLRVRSGGNINLLFINPNSANSAAYPRGIGALRVDVFGRANGLVYKHYQNLTNGAPGSSTIIGNLVIDKLGGVNGALPGGDIAEIIAYTNTLAFDQLTKLYYSYLKPKYGLP